MDWTIPRLPDELAMVGKREPSRYGKNTLTEMNLHKFLPLDSGDLVLSEPSEPPRKRRSKRLRGQDPGASGPSLFDMLPADVLERILVAVDIPSIIALRCVSRRLMAAINALRPYQVLRTHCADILRAAVALQARSFSLDTLYATLCRHACDHCGFCKDDVDEDGPKRMAGFLYLVTCKRLCDGCFVWKDDYYPMTVSQAAVALDMSPDVVVSRFPTIRSITGHYTIRRKQRKSTVLVDRAAVRAECQRQRSEGLIGPETQDQVEARHAGCDTDLDLRNREPWGHVVMIAAPLLDESRKTVDYGAWCGKCSKNTAPKWPIRSRHGILRTSEMVQHLAEWHNLAAASRTTDLDKNGGATST